MRVNQKLIIYLYSMDEALRYRKYITKNKEKLFFPFVFIFLTPATSASRPAPWTLWPRPSCARTSHWDTLPAQSRPSYTPCWIKTVLRMEVSKWVCLCNSLLDLPEVFPRRARIWWSRPLCPRWCAGGLRHWRSRCRPGRWSQSILENASPADVQTPNT